MVLDNVKFVARKFGFVLLYSKKVHGCASSQYFSVEVRWAISTQNPLLAHHLVIDITVSSMKSHTQVI